MYHSKIALAITSPTNKPYKEYNYQKLHENCKKSDVILPFDSEYKILIKNENKNRLKLDIDLDGSFITSSGGLIVPGNQSTFLERFIETDKKFLFVRKSHEAVQDPSNVENGLLTIKVELEKEISFEETWMEFMKNYKPPYVHYVYPPYYYPYQPYQPYYPGTVWTNGTPTVYSSALADNTLNDGHSVNYCHTSFPGESSKLCGISSMTTASYCGDPPPAYPGANGLFGANQLGPISAEQKPEVGATIEGSKSDQVFSTTDWNGSEGDALIFQFKMLGKDEKLSAKDEADLQEYKRLKAKFEGK